MTTCNDLLGLFWLSSIEPFSWKSGISKAPTARIDVIFSRAARPPTAAMDFSMTWSTVGNAGVCALVNTLATTTAAAVVATRTINLMWTSLLSVTQR